LVEAFMQDKTRDTTMASISNSDAGDAGRDAAGTVSFTERLLASDGFMVLFREGMSLVEATAAYLDGDGREESRGLDRSIALAYASESMRLTTRLMQLTSWLLLQRAVNEGELTRADAEREHSRVVIAMQDTTLAGDVFGQLPEKLRDLISRSQSLQARIYRIDTELKGKAPAAEPTVNAVAGQLGQLAAAFGRK
jgi:regulator of CtrA degradation